MRTFSTQKLLVHGTTSKFLPTILSQGLVPKPKKRSDPDWQTPYDGSYLSQNIGTAKGYARDAVAKFGGDRAYVFALIETRSPEVVADEDDLGSFLIGGTADDAISTLVHKFPSIPRRRWEARREEIEEFLTSIKRIPLASFSPEQNKVRDKILKSLKDIAHASDAVRFKDRAIGYRGANRIVYIAKIEEKGSGTFLVPVYGQSSAGDEMIKSVHKDLKKAA